MPPSPVWVNVTAGAGESGRGGATDKQCADPYGDQDDLVDCCSGYECEFVITEGPDYGAHFCTAVQCASRKGSGCLLRLVACSSHGAEVCN